MSDEADVRSASAALVSAFGSGDLDAYFGCFADDATFLRRPFQNGWISRTRKLGLLHPDHVQSRLAAETAVHNSVVKVLVRQKSKQDFIRRRRGAREVALGCLPSATAL